MTGARTRLGNKAIGRNELTELSERARGLHRTIKAHRRAAWKAASVQETAGATDARDSQITPQMTMHLRLPLIVNPSDPRKV